MYAVAFHKSTAFNPADGVDYFCSVDGQAPNIAATSQQLVRHPAATVVVAAHVRVTVGVIGDAQAVDVEVRNVDAGTSEAVAAAQAWNASPVNYSDAAMSLAVAANEGVCIYMPGETWATTNPTNVQIEGVVYFTENVEVAAEATQDSNILIAQSDISDNASAILVNQSNISDNASQILLNVSDISDNASAILVAQSDISDNTSQILVNTSDISDNASAILVAQSDISDNTSQILVNTSAISDNTSQILVNTSDISDNASAILVAQSDISDNASQILVNVSAISDNTSGIATWVNVSASVASNASDILVNQSSISDNTSAIAVESARITALDLDAGEITALNALLAQNPPGMLSAAEVAALRSKFNLALSGDEGTARG